MLAFIRSTIFLICLALSLASSAARQSAATQSAAATLKISGVGLTDTDLAADKLAALPRVHLKVKEKDEKEVEYEGVRIADVLAEAGMKFGQSLRGERLSNYLLAESADGYRVIFALTELDSDFSDRIVIIADRCDGKPIEGRDGPLRIIVSDERKHARWVRNIAKLTVLAAPAADKPH